MFYENPKMFYEHPRIFLENLRIFLDVSDGAYFLSVAALAIITLGSLTGTRPGP